MKHFIILFVAALAMMLFVLIGASPANADIWPGLDAQPCMADAFGGKLNCTANDVEITNVNPIDGNGDRATLPDGTPNENYDAVECATGTTFVLNADLTIRTNANERWDTTFYMPLNDKSPMDLQGNQPNCSLAVPNPADANTEHDPDGYSQPAYVDLDSDECGDITKALGPDQYTLYDEDITMYCQPSPDDPTRALFKYCAAWENKTGDNCYADIASPSPNVYYGQVPSQKSKCKCDDITIDVFIKPPAPTISKTLVSPESGSRPEPGGVYTFDISFTNTSSTTSLFLSALTDEIDITGDGVYDVSIDLWGTPVVAGSADGIYLTASNCPTPGAGESLVQIGPSGTYSCQIEVTIVDTDLPDDQSPELYDDVIMAVLEDIHTNPVVNGDTCPVNLDAVPGEHCSDVVRVNVTNIAPTITVTKTPSVEEVLEPGADVTFTVQVTSTAGSYDDPLTITSLVDGDFGDLTLIAGSTCSVPQTLYLGSPYICTFTEYIAGNSGDPAHSNTVTAEADDNENDKATNQGTATVNISDVPSAIRLVKTAGNAADGADYEVLETGDDASLYRDVAYKYEFSVLTSGVDNVTFSSLEDDTDETNDGNFEELDEDLTAVCMVDMKNGDPINPVNLYDFVLAPGEWASCTITRQVQGNAGATWFNLATIYGTDDDEQAVEWSDNATVKFLDAEPDIAQEFAMKATAFVRITNAGVDTLTINTITFREVSLAAGNGESGKFDILDETSTSEYLGGGDTYSFCSTGEDILPGGRYDCAFTLKLYPGFETGNIDLLASGAKGLVFTLVDDEGGEVTADVDVSIQTQE